MYIYTYVYRYVYIYICIHSIYLDILSILSQEGGTSIKDPLLLKLLTLRLFTQVRRLSANASEVMGKSPRSKWMGGAPPLFLGKLVS